MNWFRISQLIKRPVYRYLIYLSVMIPLSILFWGVENHDSFGFLFAAPFLGMHPNSPTPPEGDRFLTKPLVPFLAGLLGWILPIHHAFALTSFLFSIGTVFLFDRFLIDLDRNSINVFVSVLLMILSWPFVILIASILTDTGGFFFLLLIIYWHYKYVWKEVQINQRSITLLSIILILSFLTRETLIPTSILITSGLVLRLFLKKKISYKEILFLIIPYLLATSCFFLYGFIVGIDPFFLAKYNTQSSSSTVGYFNKLWGVNRFMVTFFADFTIIGSIYIILGIFFKEDDTNDNYLYFLATILIISLFIIPVMVSRYTFSLFIVTFPLMTDGIFVFAERIHIKLKRKIPISLIVLSLIMFYLIFVWFVRIFIIYRTHFFISKDCIDVICDN